MDAFWSITIYKESDGLFVVNDHKRYSRGTWSGLEKDGSGVTTLYIQNGEVEKADGTLHPNWLPAPLEPFYLISRLYIPTAGEAFPPGSGDYAYTPPVVVKV